MFFVDFTNLFRTNLYKTPVMAAFVLILMFEKEFESRCETAELHILLLDASTIVSFCIHSRR